jgi:phenylalanine-4-hydroxylase
LAKLGANLSGRNLAGDTRLPRRFADFSEDDHTTWRRLYARLTDCRARLAHPLFAAGLAELGIGPERIPDLDAVNRRLARRTNWRGVLVSGLEGPVDFFASLARREFPVGHFIRSGDDLNYTPAPDVFHDLYGHLPFFADRDYALFCERFGAAALRFAGSPLLLRQFERVFWFGVEFPLVETAGGRRIFGAGILSSYTESNFSLASDGEAPEVLPFSVEGIRRQEFRIDEVQRRVYVLNAPEQLYASLAPLVVAVEQDQISTGIPS